MKIITCILFFFFVSMLILSCSIIGGEEPPEFLFTANADPPEGGTIFPDSAVFEEGTTVTAEATPADGFLFGSWTGDVLSDDNSISFEITRNTEVTAFFERISSEYEVELSVADDSDSMVLKFGQKATSSAELDDSDQESPPPPPEDALHSYFSTSGMDLLYDFRSDTALSVSWNLNYQIGTGDELQFSWTINATSLNGTLTFRNEDSSISVDMKNESSVVVPASGSGNLIIDYEAGS